MPIKFRCMHCRQFLGISHTKAGAIVDCPTCGRSVRVPSPDGRVEPLPDPGLNLEDAQLAGALDELARIGQPAPPAGAEEGSPAEPQPGPAQSAVVVAPAPQPAPVQVDPPAPVLAPALVRPEPKPPEELERTGDETNPQAAARRLDEVTASSAPLPHLPASIPVTGGRLLWPALRTLPAVLLLSGIAVTAFGLGFVLGRSAAAPVAAPPEAGSAPAAAANDGVAAGAEAPAVRGRIAYKTSDGQSRPDRGARVLVFPEERKGTALLPVTGFRRGDDPADFAVATAGLRALGGNAAVADEEGAFELSLPAAGRYQVLVLSAYQPRGDEPTAPALRRLLAGYFERPEQLLGRVTYYFSQVRYSGEGTESLYHSFEQP